MHIRNSIALVFIESMPYDSQKLLRSQKEDPNFIKNLKNWELNTKKKHMSDPLNEYFVHWVPVYCKWGLFLTELLYEKWLVSKWLKWQ